MEDIVSSTSSPRLLDAADANHATFWVTYGGSEGGSLRHDTECVWVIAGIPLSLYNCFARCRLEDHAFEREFSRFMGALRARHVPAMWWIGPGTRPTHIVGRLLKEGWLPAGSLPGMAADLTPITPSPVPGLRIERVSSAEQRTVWAETMNRGMGFVESVVSAAVKVELDLDGPAYASQHRYLGYLDERPVATGMMLPDAGVAGIYAVATLPNVRKRGIGTAMTHRAMADALELGYRVTTLNASELGRPLYERLGFTQICTYDLYAWQP